MTKTGVEIRDVVIGDDFRIQRTYTGLPTGMSIAKAWLTIKESDRQIDADALLQNEITTSVTAAGQITDADTTGGDIALYFDLARAETATARHVQPYLYDVQIQVSDGSIHTLEKGTIVFILGVTDANT